MALIEHTNLGELEPIRKCDWQTRARVSTKWRQINRNTGHVCGFNMILVDEYHDRIYVWVREALIPRFDDQFLEGETYLIQNFIVEKYDSRAKDICFEESKYIVLTSITMVTRLPGAHSRIPLHLWKFGNISTIQQLHEPTYYLIDIIGVVQFVEKIHHLNNRNNQEQSCIKFFLNDINDVIQVTFWNDMAAAFEIAINEPLQQPLILLIQSCKIVRSNVTQMVSLANVGATRFLLNPEIRRTLNLRRRFIEAEAEEIGD